MDLRPRQARFVNEYIKSRDGQDAAIKAGYSPKTARIQAAQLLARLNIRNAVRDELDAIASRMRISVEKVLREVAIVAFSDLGDFLDFAGDEITEKKAKQIDPRKRRALQSVKITTKTIATDAGTETTRSVEYRLWDKPAALDKLARHLGLFLDQEEIAKLMAKADELRQRANIDKPPEGPSSQ